MAPSESGAFRPNRDEVPRFRGKGDQRVDAAPQLPVPPSTMWGLQEAIEKGDYLPNTDASPPIPTERRALLVAVQYNIDRRVGPLYSTPNDIWDIYQMLRTHGYREKDIRILSEGFADDDRSSPTKQNIKAGLEWLVQGARPGDFRYFHFSGHGEVFESNSKEGKEARVIPNGLVRRRDGDTEIVPLGSAPLNQEANGGDQSAIRVDVDTQTIPVDEVKYYNEAILTLAKSPSWFEKLTYPTEYIINYNRIRDKELNDAFACLPEGCTLTTTLDCCHSGRMLNMNYKLEGGGFRGTWNGSTSDTGLPAIEWGPESTTQPQTRSVPCTTSNGCTWFLPRIFNLEVAVETNGTTRNTQIHPDANDNSDRGANDPSMRTMDRFLPERERAMDGIKANVILWSGCHHRQQASDHRNQRGGYFTSAFTRAVEEGAEDLTLRELHAMVDNYLHDDIVRSGGATAMLQYCQLWTSLGSGDRAQAEEKLNRPFII